MSVDRAPCVTDDQVLRLLRGELVGEALAAVERHLNGCGDCRRLVAQAAELLFEDSPQAAEDPTVASTAEEPRPSPLGIGTKVSRYVVVGALGAGGEGVVYRARDPELGRDVALKLTSLSREGQVRLVAEAQALAKLAHPNVVNVFDVGRLDGQVFMVLELVEGKTLGRWLRERPRSAREIVRVFIEAGRGLAAAHAAGLVHRDFKPDNVLVGVDGRARVTDFGLARDDGAAEGRPGSVLVAGTPAYMAPEQLQGAAPDARSDQFSFCVALNQALHGSRPPAGLQAVLARGLKPKPDLRYPSMDALLLALIDATERSGRSRAAIGAVAVIVVGALTWQAWRLVGSPSRCGDGRVDPGEECDDGNGRDGDGCSASCLRCAGGDARFVWAANGHCYTRHDTPASWASGRAACRAIGAHLVTYNDLTETLAVSKHLLETNAAGYWIGLTDAWEDARYGWLTQEPLTSGAMRWNPQPTPPGLCIVQRSTPAPGWTGEPCSRPRGALCEQEPWARHAKTNHAFRSFDPERSWHAARRLCEQAGAHLLTITDADELAFVSAHFFGTLWLGASRATKGGRFTWVTREPFQFQPFGPDDPDMTREAATCLVLGVDHHFRDRLCDTGPKEGPYGVVCEID